jgi:PAS domain S-box-containing protein
LNEIFAEYFINEFDDPLNAYTSSMANYGGAAAAVAMSQHQPTFLSAAPTTTVDTGAVNDANDSASNNNIMNFSMLPTGGIKTAFHAGSAAGITMNATTQPQQMVQEPLPKKIKQDDAMHDFLTTPNVAPTNQQQAPAYSLPVGQGGLAGRLGFSLVQGQVAISGNQLQEQQQLQHQQQLQQQQQQQLQLQQQQQLQIQQQQQQQQQLAAKPSSAVPLPVGVGIKLGGIGGVAPSTVAQTMIARPAGYTMPWGGMTPAVTEHAVAERRQRNREHAKKSRVRKKFMLESLQMEVKALQKVNAGLRMLIQEKIPQQALEIIQENCQQSPLFADLEDMLQDDGEYDEDDQDDESATKTTKKKKKKKSTNLVQSDFTLVESLTSGQQNFVLSDPRLPDNPIVYASPGFYHLSGYTSDQVLGRNCRFLQGPGTDPKAVDVIRTAVANGSDATVCLLNYKADGTPFWNQFFVAALRDADNCIVNYVSNNSEGRRNGETHLSDSMRFC